MSVMRFDGLYLDPSDGAFKPLATIVNPYLPMVEIPAGSGNYSGEEDIATWLDGNYEIKTYDATDSANPALLDTEPLYVDAGSGPPIATNQTRVDHNYGAKDALRYTEANGTPVQDAEVYVFDQADYASDAPTLQAVAKTLTTLEGRWASPVFLSSGTYVVLFYKKKKWGPDTQTITIA